MDRIGKITKQTDNPFLNLYSMEVTYRSGGKGTYFLASRHRNPEDLKAVCHNGQPDGVVIFAVNRNETDRIALVRQYRYPLGDYIYELPAGLVEPDEDPTQAAVREFYEETGMTLIPREAGSYSRPFYTTVGLTDECCATVFGTCTGKPTNLHQEASEDIQVILADRKECRRILREENVALKCAYLLMNFVANSGDPLNFLAGAE